VQAHSSERPDYGAALRAGFLASSGEEVVNFDVDGVDLEFLARARRVAQEEGADIVVGSKMASGAADGRVATRRAVTACFSLVMRRGFGLRVSDTHGVKLLRRAPVAPIVLICRFGQDIFDTELVLRAERAGLRVAELPVTVVERRPPRSPISRRIPRSLLGLAKLRVGLWLGR
ncbi:MAG: glycosyltransferase family 2 protein, partial [Acidimicrobiales bacterium]